MSSAGSVVDLGLRQRPEHERDRPLAAALRELGPGEAEEEDRRAGREQRDVLDQVEERLLAPLDVVEDETSGACSSSSLRNAQAISSADVASSVSPQERADRRGRGGSEGRASSCLITSTTGQ